MMLLLRKQLSITHRLTQPKDLEGSTVCRKLRTKSVECTAVTSVTSLCPVQTAVGYDYQAKLAQHESQTDSKKGFGGKYGVQKDRQDKVLSTAH